MYCILLCIVLPLTGTSLLIRNVVTEKIKDLNGANKNKVALRRHDVETVFFISIRCAAVSLL